MFQLNDIVLYGAEGVYRISEIRKMDFKGPEFKQAPICQ